MSSTVDKPVVTIELMDGDDAQAIAQAVEEDNPGATIEQFVGIVAIKAPSPMVIRRSTVEEFLGGGGYSLRRVQEIVADYYGNLTESSEDQWVLEWKH